MKHEESEIQVAIVEWLAENGYYYFSVPNELGGKGKGAMIRTARLKTMGLRPGVADLVVMLPYYPVFLEVKTKTGKQSESQKRFHEHCSELEYEYYVVRSVEEVEKILKIDRINVDQILSALDKELDKCVE